MQLPAKFLAGRGVVIELLLAVLLVPASALVAAWQQRVEDAFLGVVLGLRVHAFLGLVAGQFVGDVGEVAHDRIDILADVADLGEFGRFDLHERGLGQRRESTRDLGLADAGRADHQDVLGRHFVAERGFKLHPAPAVAQRDGDRALRVVLADDEAVEFVDDFAGGEFGHGNRGWVVGAGGEGGDQSQRGKR